VTTRLVLDELDLDLPALAARLVRIVGIVVGLRALALYAPASIANEGAIVFVDRRGRVLVVVGDF